MPEGCIQIKVKAQPLKGMHLFKQDHQSQQSSVTTWSDRVRPYPHICMKPENTIDQKRKDEEENWV